MLKVEQVSRVAGMRLDRRQCCGWTEWGACRRAVLTRSAVPCRTGMGAAERGLLHSQLSSHAVPHCAPPSAHHAALRSLLPLQPGDVCAEGGGAAGQVALAVGPQVGGRAEFSAAGGQGGRIAVVQAFGDARVAYLHKESRREAGLGGVDGRPASNVQPGIRHHELHSTT